MSALPTVAAAAMTVWLLVISIVTTLMVRQVAVVSKWARERSENDGLEIGAEIPERVLLLRPELSSGLSYLAIIDGASQQGREFALEAGRNEDLARLRGRAAVTVAVAGGGRQLETVARLLPAWFDLASGDVADSLKLNLKVRQTPAIYEIEGGRVTGKAGAGYGVDNFVNLIKARDHSDAAEFAGEPETR